MTQPLVQVENLKMHFPIKGGPLGKTVSAVKAVDGVSFHINKGETLGLVGESGCGKSTTGECCSDFLNRAKEVFISKDRILRSCLAMN